MTSRALWFGPEGRPLFGWLETPDDGVARGAVVLCPALGLEGVCAARAFRHLAERLAGAGVAALRVDYDGTGDSAGRQDDPGRVEAWLASVRSAVDLVRAAGARRVVVVGLRVGATVAACEAARGGVDGIVLWDPCASGRSYLREQQALGLFSLGGKGDDDGSVEIPGIVFAAETVTELGSLSIADTEGPLADHVLVLVRPERPANKAMKKRLEMDHVEWGDAEGQSAFVDVEPFEVREPAATVDAVVSWVSAVMGPEASTFAVPPGAGGTTTTTGTADGDRTVAIVDGDGDGRRAVVERIVTIGETGLFGIVSEPAEPARRTVILLNAGLIDHVGPSRLWVDFARRWARGGVRVLRFDLSGLGLSPARPGQREDEMYPPEAFDDLAEVVGVMAGDDAGDVVLTGLCSGGYHSIEGGIALGVGGVCVINPILTARPSEIRAGDDAGGTSEIDPRRRATTARKRWVRALPAHDLLGSIVDRLPDAAWWIINRVAVASPPARIIERLVANGVETYVVCGESEARVMRRGQAAAFRRLARSGRFHLEVMPGIDHELFARASRDRVGPVVTERILGSVTTTEPVRRV
ncbi:MAG TPA: alpha/beta fold hydrolase [Acidimicrobiales bacterium]|nr:alpha/beta fold hydrolase [Acidimicrobiales bacterium]